MGGVYCIKNQKGSIRQKGKIGQVKLHDAEPPCHHGPDSGHGLPTPVIIHPQCVALLGRSIMLPVGKPLFSRHSCLHGYKGAIFRSLRSPETVAA